MGVNCSEADLRLIYPKLKRFALVCLNDEVIYPHISDDQYSI